MPVDSNQLATALKQLQDDILQEQPDDVVGWIISRLHEKTYNLPTHSEHHSIRTRSISRPSHYKPHMEQIMTDPQFNKGTAFTAHEREAFKLEGLLPFQIETLDQQIRRCETIMRSYSTPLHKFTYLTNLKETNQTLFFGLVLQNLEECLPLIYTPTVGEACLKFDGIFSYPQGMYITSRHKGHIRHILDNWTPEVDIIVVSDGSRILGLGDLGANGMGIPVGKLSLYIVAAGFHPARTLPMILDTGTNNKKYSEEDPFYLGERRPKLPDDEYYAFTDEFITAVKDKWPNCLLQFEDFSNDHCFALLERYRHQMRCFNDDIQGTGAVIAAGFINAVRLSGVPLEKHVIVFFGAGSAGVGVADQIVALMCAHGANADDVRKQLYLVDTKGLVTVNRGDKLAAHKVPYARKDVQTQLSTLLDIVKTYKPTALIGLAGQPAVFNEEIVTEMVKHCERPIIFPLSNPTSKAECSAEQAYTWTNGKCIFASGSPFAPVHLNGKVYVPGQGNNMYVFPGLGMGAFLSRASEVSDEMILAAAEALVDCVTPAMLEAGTIYPPLTTIRNISLRIALRVMQKAYEQKLATVPLPGDMESFVLQNMWVPEYLEA